jgi:uncharacterized protein (TIGR02231 family)
MSCQAHPSPAEFVSRFPEVFMRALFCFALLLPCPALADTIAAQSRITAVTVYPQSALVTREVSFDAPAGSNDLVITDLPMGTSAEMIRLTADEGTALGAYALRTDRLPPQLMPETPEQLAAKAEIERLEGAEREAQATIDAINARVEAADAQAGFLRGVVAEGGTLTVDALRDISGMIGQEVLAARQAALLAKADFPAAEKVLADAQEALAKAREAEAALATGAENYASLTVAIESSAAGKGSVTVSHFVDEAYWQPVYDMMLTRQPSPELIIKRGVLVSQYSGEDWSGVALTLSTAMPSSQSAPSALWTDLRRIEPEVTEEMKRAARDALEQDGMGGMAEPVMEPAVVAAATMSAMIEGDVVVYTYPTPANVATGVENLRLALDEIKVSPDIVAQAVPRYDMTAFMMATLTNDTGEVLLPGTAYLHREGTLVGATDIAQTAPGMEVELPFGAIEGLRLKRDMPVTAEGDRGVFTTSTQREEKAVLEVENLTDEVWPVRLLDQVPYSEQEDLEITYTADPAPTEVNVDGQRGILGWEFDVAPGETKAVNLTTVMQWPEGMVLR